MTVETMDESGALAEPKSRQDLGGLLGLRDGREAPFPLREVRVRSSIVGNCCRTVVEQLFDNPYDAALEAVHIFPLPHDGAVTELELRAGQVLVRAECREREEAERIFERARTEGRRAALLNRERPDIHTLRITNIPAKTSVAARIVVVERLQDSDGAFLWRFPVVIAPRYTPGVPTGHAGPGTHPDTDQVPDASRLQPPLMLGAGARLDLEVEVTGPVSAIESSLHAVRTTLGASIRVAPSTRATLDRDFVLRIAPGERDDAVARSFTSGDYTMVIVPPSAAAAPGRNGARGSSERVGRDAVFVIDISGSMSGTKLEAARRAVSAALHGLERGDRFRLIAFDDRLEIFAPECSDYTADTLAEADRWIAALHARGGTEMLPALAEALRESPAPDRVRTVLFVTDGQATNEDALIAAASRRPANTVLFTVGIDTAVNASLLDRLARAGGGTCELLTPQDDVEEAIVRLEARFGAPLASAVRASSGEPGRREDGVLFDGRPATLLLKGAGEIDCVTMTTSAGAVSVPCAAPVPVSFPLEALWARERIAWLDDELARSPERVDEIRAAMVGLGLAHHLVSRFTSFVAVEERAGEKGELRTVVQPVMLPAEWSPAFLDMSVACAAVAPPMPAIGGSGSRYLVRLAKSGVERLRKAEGERPRVAAPPSIEAFQRVDEPAAETRGIDRGIDGVRRQVSVIAVSQEADGSFGGRVDRTAAAVAALVLLGSTRRKGTRRRVVAKAATWLASRRPDPTIEAVLRMLDAAEAAPRDLAQDELLLLLGDAVVATLRAADSEGRFFAAVIAQRW